MDTQIQNSLPHFFSYEEEGKTDAGYEAMQDFFLSWTLRCSAKKYQKDNYLLNHYSKRILYALLYGQNKNNSFKFEVDFSKYGSFEVKEITTKRQLGRIDLLVISEIIRNGITEKIALLIENKWYSKVTDEQLKKYSEFINNDSDFREFKKMKVVVYCDDCIINSHPTQKEICKNNEYSFTNIGTLKDFSEIDKYGKTGNYLFDEYWINF